MKLLAGTAGLLLLGSMLAHAYVRQDGAAPLQPGAQARVVNASAVLRSRASSLSSAVATLKGGDAVQIVEAAPPWYRARANGADGYLHGSSLLAQEQYALAVGQGAQGVSYAERTAAARGFNPKVEEQHKAENPDLTAGYQRVDAIEARKVSDAALIEFRRQGGLD